MRQNLITWARWQRAYRLLDRVNLFTLSTKLVIWRVLICQNIYSSAFLFIPAYLQARSKQRPNEEAKHTLPFSAPDDLLTFISIFLPRSWSRASISVLPQLRRSSLFLSLVLFLYSGTKREKRRRDRGSRALSWNESRKLLILLAVSFTPVEKAGDRDGWGDKDTKNCKGGNKD